MDRPGFRGASPGSRIGWNGVIPRASLFFNLELPAMLGMSVSEIVFSH